MPVEAEHADGGGATLRGSRPGGCGNEGMVLGELGAGESERPNIGSTRGVKRASWMCPPCLVGPQSVAEADRGGCGGVAAILMGAACAVMPNDST